MRFHRLKFDLTPHLVRINASVETRPLFTSNEQWR